MEEFWNYYNPKYMAIRKKEYADSIKDKYEFADFKAWKHGEYTLDAIACAFDSRKHKYPVKPRLMEQQSNHIDTAEEAARGFDKFAKAYKEKHNIPNYEEYRALE